MKTTDDFWEIIGRYNVETTYLQFIFSFLVIGVLLFSFFKQNHLIDIFLKSLFSTAFFFVGIYFFLVIDKSFTAMIFGPYFILTGLLFSLDLLNSKSQFQQITPFQLLLYVLVLLYPAISYALGHKYPQQVLYISPCPITSFALITYCRLNKRSDLLNLLLILWGLTGVKAFIFDVKEDLILLIVGTYGLYDFIKYKLNVKNQIT
jgi:hypothetical protein